MQHSWPFLAPSVAEQCWQLSWSSPHTGLSATCIKADRELGQPKGAAVHLFHIGHIYL